MFCTFKHIKFCLQYTIVVIWWYLVITSLTNCLLSQVALLLKIFSQVTFTILHISFVNIKGYFHWQKPSHATFSPHFFCLLFFYCKVFSQLKNMHCNINIEVSFSCPTVVKFYIVFQAGYCDD